MLEYDDDETFLINLLGLIFLITGSFVFCYVGTGEFILCVGVFEIAVAFGALAAGSWGAQPAAFLLASGVLWLNVGFCKLRKAKQRHSPKLVANKDEEEEDDEDDPITKAKAILAALEKKDKKKKKSHNAIEMTPLHITEDMEDTSDSSEGDSMEGGELV